ncbi:MULTISPECIES: hypothetical protein [Hahella]|uniref:hypothetical protein n=1 Tax=Hahella TaxID=158481 RepID=UPI0002EB2D77|nr:MULTISPECIES: hypothetical protein [Hahella]AZZ90783.1 hypothetical protein ENC22_06110 [Hahella sp. KA22]MBU6950071.1 hypothetical protein [Hahella sp. HN01]MDG9671139.1 hypothetical protein [Hahella sp. CR1]QAY54154.1 hypothetical protein EUZ85_08665 [Hahella sp. KA22]
MLFKIFVQQKEQLAAAKPSAPQLPAKFPVLGAKLAPFLFPFCMSAFLVMMAMDYLISGHWQAAPYYLSASIVLASIIAAVRTIKKKQ